MTFDLPQERIHRYRSAAQQAVAADGLVGRLRLPLAPAAERRYVGRAMVAMRLSSTPQIFLSHSGRDASRAIGLAAQLEAELTKLGHVAHVFNTSEPEYRYGELREVLTLGEDWRSRAEQYDRELREYLRENLTKSVAFLTLVTPESLSAASKLIEFEIETARAVALQNGAAFFFPCVAGGAHLSQLPGGAIEFQGVALDEEGGLGRLIEGLCRAMPS